MSIDKRVGVVGLYSSGKTVFLTSLINHLSEHDPSLCALNGGKCRVEGFREQYAGAADVITLRGKLSVVTYLHEFAHVLGRREGSLSLVDQSVCEIFPRAVRSMLSPGAHVDANVRTERFAVKDMIMGIALILALSFSLVARNLWSTVILSSNSF